VQKLKKIFAVFSLLVFLFPLVETEIHDYAHADDFHCTAATQHLHKAEHHCSLCDFTSHFSAAPSFNDYHFRLSKITILHFFSSEDHYPIQSRDFLSPRAPPSFV